MFVYQIAKVTIARSDRGQLTKLNVCIKTLVWYWIATAYKVNTHVVSRNTIGNSHGAAHVANTEKMLHVVEYVCHDYLQFIDTEKSDIVEKRKPGAGV